MVLVLSSAAGAAPPYRVNMSVEAFGNTIDGSRGPRCEASEEVETGKKTEWWITLGESRPDPRGGWEGVGNAIRCGVGSFEERNVGSGSSSQTPYLMATVSTMPAVVSTQIGTEKVLQVEISLSFRKLLGFSEPGEPRYEQSNEKRSFFFLERGTVFLPLIVANGKEKETFKLHEALIKVRAEPVKKEGATAYGTVLVSSDINGAEILLDGGVVGRVSAGKETVLRNVLVGDREVSVRDSSGREIRRVVRVEENRTTLVALNLLGTARNETPYSLVFVGKNSQGYEEYRRKMDDALVVKIPAGEFLMGNRETERQPLEHQVYVSAFLIDKTLVTWGQYKKFAQGTGTPLPPHLPYWGVHDDHPAVFVTWEEAKAYCEWVGGRLPTEAEWEKAARGTDGRKYPWGNEEPAPQRAVYRRNWGDVATDPVGVHPSGASPYGLLDMAGNVWEWCADWYDDKYYEVSPRQDPKGPPTGRAHVVRGGSWDSRPSVLSCSCRNWGYRGYREGDFGFRCAMDPLD